VSKSITKIRARVAAALRDDRGNTTAAIAFAVIASVLMTAMVSATISVMSVASVVDKSASVDSAIETRYSQWESELGTAAGPAVGDVCYPAFDVCVSIAEVAETPSGTAVKLAARYDRDDGVRERVKIHATDERTHIIGFDSSGAAVWGSAG
jgi:hypothetical protein